MPHCYNANASTNFPGPLGSLQFHQLMLRTESGGRLQLCWLFELMHMPCSGHTPKDQNRARKATQHSPCWEAGTMSWCGMAVQPPCSFCSMLSVRCCGTSPCDSTDPHRTSALHFIAKQIFSNSSVLGFGVWLWGSHFGIFSKVIFF